jgi:hypothetical protein
MIGLSKELPRLLPLAVGWASLRSSEILETGIPLSRRELALARFVGVRCPERVRIETVPAIPLPEHVGLRGAAMQAELIGPSTTGLTLGYGIYLVAGRIGDRLLRHECRHVYPLSQEAGLALLCQLYSMFQ